MPLFRFGGRSRGAAGDPQPGPDTAAVDAVAVSKVLPRLVTALGQVDTPVIMDLGPVVGANVAFFGEELACKLHVQDAFAVVERYAASGHRDEAGAAVLTALTLPPASADAVLCWDLFDYLDRAAAKGVASRLIELLKPGGYLYAFFGNAAGEARTYSRFTVVSRSELRIRTRPATPTQRQVYMTREIDKMFEGLGVIESVLLKSRSRETLFRKPA